MLAASAILPSILLVWYFRHNDENPEPAAVLWKTFFLGVLTVIPVLIVAGPPAAYLKAYADPFMRGVLKAIFTAALPEEFFKFLVVVLFASRHKEFDEPMDGIVYGAVASLGFATLENILCVAQGGLGLAVLRALTAVPGHAAMGAIMGYYVARAKFGREPKASALAKGYFIPVVLHALYDAPLLALNEGAATTDPLVAASPLLAIGVLIFEITWVRRLVHQLRDEQVALLTEARAVHIETPVAQLDVVEVAVAAVHPPVLRQPSLFVATLYLIPGVILSSIGGLLSLGILIAFFTGGVKEADANSTLVGGIIAGAVPLLLGLWLFRRGLLRMRPQRALTSSGG